MKNNQQFQFVKRRLSLFATGLLVVLLTPNILKAQMFGNDLDQKKNTSGFNLNQVQNKGSNMNVNRVQQNAIQKAPAGLNTDDAGSIQNPVRNNMLNETSAENVKNTEDSVQANRTAPARSQNEQKQTESANTGDTAQKTVSRPVRSVPNNETPRAFEFRFVGGGVDVQEKQAIFLSMKDYKISKNLDGATACSVRFTVLSTLPSKISNISYKLKWPDLETALSFEDVEPNVENFYDYTFLGKGCYSLDKVPNVIVNRCRVKGMTQKNCAAGIQWIS